MRNDVIHNRRRNDLSLCLTEGTERMLFQEKSASLTPTGIISPGISTTAHPVITVHSVILTEHLTLFAEPGTPRVAAGAFSAFGAFSHLRSDNQKASVVINRSPTVYIFQRPIQRHDQSHSAVHFLRGFFLVDLQVPGRISPHEGVVQPASELQSRGRCSRCFR